MNVELPELARAIGADARTLRRAAAEGAIRASRPSPRRLRLAPGERAYLRRHWPLLARLRAALRTEPNVRLAVLYGSVARGEADRDSDIDLAVELRDAAPEHMAAVQARLEDALDRRVDIAGLARVVDTAPVLAAEMLKDGRVVADRDGSWPAWVASRPAIERRAAAAFRDEMAAARQALARLEARSMR